MRDAYTAAIQKETDDPEPEGVFGVKFSWMCYWYASLYVTIEAYEAIGVRGPVIEALLTHPGGYRDLLRRFRNGVFHFQENSTDLRLLSLLNTGEEGAMWLQAIHGEFKRHLQEQIDTYRGTELAAELRRSIRSLTDWLPDHPERRECEELLEQLRQIGRRHSNPEDREQHADVAQAEAELAAAIDTFNRGYDQFRRELLRRLGIFPVDH
jgi:hypothetical protein